MSSCINNSYLTNQLEDLLRSFVKEKLEFIMREELTNFLYIEQPDTSNSRNGITNFRWTLRWTHVMEKLRTLRFPCDREGAFQTSLFAPYQRRDGWL
jgi:putative transposase